MKEHFMNYKLCDLQLKILMYSRVTVNFVLRCKAVFSKNAKYFGYKLGIIEHNI